MVNSTMTNNIELRNTQDTPYFDPLGSFPNEPFYSGWGSTDYTEEPIPNDSMDLETKPYRTLHPMSTSGNFQHTFDFPTNSHITEDEFGEFIDWSPDQEIQAWSTKSSTLSSSPSHISSTTSTPPSQTMQTPMTLSPTTSTSSRNLSTTSNSPPTRPHSKKTYSCPNCQKPYPARHLLNRHIKTHTLPMICSHVLSNGTPCPTRTANTKEMTRHVNTAHTRVRTGGFCPFPTCKHSVPHKGFDGFARKDHLTRHLRKIHEDEVL